MRRTTRKALTHVGLFLCALLTIIYLGSAGSSGRTTFAWTTIRYRTRAASLPKRLGRCPALSSKSIPPSSPKPALIVSHVSGDGDTGWLAALGDKYHLCIYEVDAPPATTASSSSSGGSGGLRVPANRGHEAMAYLTFIIDNYDDVPAAGAVFVHGSRWAWHNDAYTYDNRLALLQLNVTAALAPLGYHNLRCDWSASTCERSALPQGSLQNLANAKLSPWDAHLASDVAMPAALVAIFGGEGGGRRGSAVPDRHLRLGRADVLRSQCCAQFVVSRARLWQHSRDEYVALRQWLLDEGSGAPVDDRVAGRIVSYLWHVLFLQPRGDGDGDGDGGPREIDLDRLNSQACPRADECYCRLYGRCGLRGCAPGRCPGEYVIPPGFKLPEDWDTTHS